MADTQLPIMALTVPSGLCYSTPQTDIPIIASLLRAIFTGNEIIYSNTTPAPSDRVKPWVRVNADGTDDGVWVFYNGYWIQKHPLPTGLVCMWEGDPTNVDAFDGGETAGITNITGPFWELVTEMAARSPMHPGTLPSGLVVNVGDNIGEETHIQTAAELVAHKHDIKTQKAGGSPGDYTIEAVRDSGGSLTLTTELTGNSPATGFNVVHPVRAILFLRRTARIHRRRNA